MWTFQYKHGDRPLEGYTIQRAAGRGGFGEVYYAISDSGREVALKVITGFEQIELRGISQCMNLKSPHLVTIFDVKQNAEGRSFVIMEFVSGLNLRELLDESPAGLGTQKAAFFLREIAKGLSYLHDCGIVHRDLKPANIFFENGYVKIGDYGLSKAIEPTQHSGQTVTVGTVHYMAPEVGVGKYDRSIDIYALGALLYEMLTGMVPFVGASPSEILFKHLSAEPDCSGIPEPFCSAIKKAMAKDPTQRYQTVQELVEAVFGAEHVRHSVSQFSPLELSVVAGRVAARIAAPVGVAAGGGSSVTSPNGLGSPKGAPEAAVRGVGGRTMPPPLPPVETARRVTSALFAPLQDTTSAGDPFSLRHRVILGVIATLVISVAAQAFSGIRDEGEAFFYTVLAIAGASAAILLTGRAWLPRPRPGHHVADRFALAGAGALGAVALSGILWMDWYTGRKFTPGMFVAYLAAFAWAHPRRWVMSDRPDRMSFKSALWAGGAAFLAALIFEGNPVLAIAIAGGAALVAQVLTPWDEVAAQRRAELVGDDDDDPDTDPIRTDDPAAFGGAQRGGLLGNLAQTAPPRAATWPPGAQPIPAINYWPATGTHYVPRGMSVVWFTGVLLFLVVGVLLHVVAANESNWNDFAAFSAFTVIMYANVIFCFWRMRVRTFNTWWEYLILPSLRHVCILVVLFCWSMLGFGRGWSRSDEEGFVITIVIFAMLWLLSWTIGWLWRMAVPPLPPMPPAISGAAQPAQDATRPTHAFELGEAIGQVRTAVHTAVTSTEAAVRDAVHGAREAVTEARATAAATATAIRARVRRPKPDVLGGFALLAGLVLLGLSFALAFVLAIDVPGMIHAGLPDPHLKQGIERDIFGNAVPDWPGLVRSIAMVVLCVTVLISAAALTFARRRANALHILRALLAVFALMLSTLVLSKVFVQHDPWQYLAQQFPSNRPGWATTQILLRGFGTPAFVAFVFLVAAGTVTLVWPRRRAQHQQLPATPQPNGATP